MTRSHRLALLPSFAVLALVASACGDSTSGALSPGGASGAGGAEVSDTHDASVGTSGSTGGSTVGGSAGTSTGTDPDAMVVGGDSAGDGGIEAGDGTFCNAGDCTDFVGGFDGFLFEYPCAAGAGCSGSMCVMGALTITQDFTIKGDADKVYQVDFRVKGVVESKNYEGGMRRSMAAIDPGAAGGDLWYEGGTVPLSTYSSYELHVKPAVAGAPNDYYLNARDGTNEHDGTTWALNYTASVKVNGGGTITFKTYDSNCSAITNCGPRGTTPCTPRTFDLSDTVPPPPASVTQPIRNANMTPVQWLHIDVTGVKAL